MRFILLALMLAATPAVADVPAADVKVSETGFVVENRAVASTAPDAVWAALVAPARYWNPDHSYSGKAENFTLDAKAGGCFCEALTSGGSVEHMRVVFAMPGSTLRLVGGLGPLQSEGVAATLTWALKATPGGTEITQTYVVGGHMRFDVPATAPLVGQVLNEQLTRLAALFPRH
ncbi:ATPase [Sphingosinicella xenopeptidilytica]|uniref:ATPase n=1 Tax=Sphingosinicella xenopeptidilytica TaxID=364098 RepID=A0ABW3C4U7_SPHXN